MIYATRLMQLNHAKYVEDLSALRYFIIITGRLIIIFFRLCLAALTRLEQITIYYSVIGEEKSFCIMILRPLYCHRL